MEKMKRRHRNRKVLLCIDMQKDFTTSNGSLYVNGANEDVNRVASILTETPNLFSECVFTMDTHTRNHITNCENWKTNGGDIVAPFTTIDVSMVKRGDLVFDESIGISTSYICDYIQKLQNTQKNFVVWPPHCINNSKGWDLDDKLYDAIVSKNIRHSYAFKGKSNTTEFYSAIEPDIIIENDINAQVNIELLSKLDSYDEIYICGEAMDVCVYETIQSLVKHLPNKVDKMFVITDCMSTVFVSKEACLKNMEEMFGISNFVTSDSLK